MTGNKDKRQISPRCPWNNMAGSALQIDLQGAEISISLAYGRTTPYGHWGQQLRGHGAPQSFDIP